MACHFLQYQEERNPVWLDKVTSTFMHHYGHDVQEVNDPLMHENRDSCSNNYAAVSQNLFCLLSSPSFHLYANPIN